MNSITCQNNINFKGHCGSELIKYGKESFLLTTETAFGRGLDTLDFAVNNINKKFPNKKTKRFVVGACSTGEEVWTLKMLENEPVEILGFDIAPRALKTAQKGIYTFLSPNSRMVRLFKNDDGYKDLFLAYGKAQTHNEEQIYNMFHKMFENKKVSKFNIFKRNKKFYKLKEAQPECKFIKGDINNIPQIIQEQKCQIFSFRNAFYHLLTYNNGIDREERDPRKIRQMLDNIFKTVNKLLDKKGLFLMGEEENTQCNNINFVFKALLDNGFIPIRRNEKFYDAWEKAKEV